MSYAKPPVYLDPRLPRWVACGVSGLHLLLALGPFALYGADYLYGWAFLTLPFCWLPVGWLLPSEWAIVLGDALLAAIFWGTCGYLFTRFFWQRMVREG